MIQLSSVEVPSNMLIHSSPGTGAVYSFDPVGSYEREACRAAGAAQSLVQPFLDNQVSSRPWTIEPDDITYTYFVHAFVFCLHGCRLTSYPFADLLQKSDTRPWDILLKTSAIIHCPVPRDRFFYWCNWTTHWGLFISALTIISIR